MDDLTLRLIKQLVLRETADLAYHLMVYGREKDNVLTRDRMEAAFSTGTVTVEEVVAAFKDEITKLV